MNGGSHENEFWQLSDTKMNIIDKAQKVDEKDGIICLISFFKKIAQNCAFFENLC